MGEACDLNDGSNLPEMASPCVHACASPTAKWYAIKVRTRAELAISNVLQTRGLSPYCPMQKERRRYSDRMKMIDTAVFPGYIFCKFEAERKLAVISARGVEYIVSVAGTPVAISEDEMNNVRRAVEAGAIATSYFRDGQRVRVTRGPLSGVEGIVSGDADGERLIVSIEFLSRSVTLNIDRGLTCPIFLN
jgi:transcription antitermination factor NusG